MAVSPQFFEHIRDHDKDFAATDYFKAMTWLKDEKDDLYDPSYTDMLRVSFTSEFKRGKMSDLVSLLSGRNFETRDFEETIAADTFDRMRFSALRFMKEDYFKKFVMIIRSAGFIAPELIRSKNALDFAYIIYIKLREEGVPQGEIGRLVSKWFVFSVLTSRYGGSPESTFDYDIKQMSNKPFREYLDSVEQAELSDSFWNFGLIQRLDTSIGSSPVFHVYQAAQVKGQDRGFLSRDITVADIILYKGDIHHIFPKNYLKTNNKSRGDYNQIANYVLMQQEINIAIGAKSPNIYFNELRDQCNGGKMKYGAINTLEELMQNLKTHCIPESIFESGVDGYDKFLVERRKLMVEKMKKYYNTL
jgi:aspartate carbamoyltransferase regulatory subunit